ncbi:MAG: hypothetical protein ACRD04_09615 [Terriglobales bacterium]
MSRKKRRHYKLVQPEPMVPRLSARAEAIVTVVQWAFWFALAGILVAFLLILSLFAHIQLSAQTWLRLWPASFQLMTATGEPSKSLAIWLTVENGLLYCGFGIVLGLVWVGMRALRRRLQPRYN